MENRKRNVHLHVMVTPDELAAIHERMAEAGISNAGAYVRKMALNGYILHVDLAPIKELISLQRRCSNNLNQVAVHAHTYGVYPEEIDGLKRDYEKLWGEVSKVLRELSELCLLYTSILLTGTVGLLITYLCYQSMNYRGIAFSVPILPVSAAVLLVLAVCVDVYKRQLLWL